MRIYYTEKGIPRQTAMLFYSFCGHCVRTFPEISKNLKLINSLRKLKENSKFSKIKSVAILHGRPTSWQVGSNEAHKLGDHLPLGSKPLT